jgi:hypothetical protein
VFHGRVSHGRVSDGRASTKRVPHGRASHERVSHVSQVIPRDERDNGELSQPEAAAASSRPIQGGTQEGTQEGTRKSVRACKPITRN